MSLGYEARQPHPYICSYILGADVVDTRLSPRHFSALITAHSLGIWDRSIGHFENNHLIVITGQYLAKAKANTQLFLVCCLRHVSSHILCKMFHGYTSFNTMHSKLYHVLYITPVFCSYPTCSCAAGVKQCLYACMCVSKRCFKQGSKYINFNYNLLPVSWSHPF